jgi:hypothetical protein
LRENGGQRDARRRKATLGIGFVFLQVRNPPQGTAVMTSGCSDPCDDFCRLIAGFSLTTGKDLALIYAISSLEEKLSRLSRAVRKILKSNKQRTPLPLATSTEFPSVIDVPAEAPPVIDARTELPPVIDVPIGSTPIMDAFEALNFGNDGHAAGAFPTSVLKTIEACLPREMVRTAETGCGKSTILFSNVSNEHHVFSYDDRELSHSSVAFYESCELTQLSKIEPHFGATQKVVPAYSHQPYDAVLIDGPHGWPFPELEYYFFYPHIRTNGILIIDDVHIPTIGRMADIIAENEMWSFVGLAGITTAIFKRTDAPVFDPYCDGWYMQTYNRRRLSSKNSFFVSNGEVQDKFTSMKLNDRLHGE